MKMILVWMMMILTWMMLMKHSPMNWTTKICLPSLLVSSKQEINISNYCSLQWPRRPFVSQTLLSIIAVIFRTKVQAKRTCDIQARFIPEANLAPRE
eukprot:m.69202 g.69202  ORF g.69202 m.69202 type:complete len:97 (+) comp12218_c4_seq1:158-448(+)